MLGKKYEMRGECAASRNHDSTEGPESKSHEDEALTS